LVGRARRELPRAAPGIALYLPRARPVTEGTPLRVATINVLAQNRDGARVREWIRTEDPDLIAVQEVELFWLEELKQLADVWPHRVTFPEAEDEFHAQTFGMVMLSKRPLRALERFTHLGRSGGIVAEAAIVLGDLNTSSGSPAFDRLLRDGRVHDTRWGFGRQPTWRTFRPIPGLWVDIDHVLVSARFRVADRRVGRENGSDHLPVAVDLILTPMATATAR
jgi:endonuclease/exonuclease/phosphatase (EEP) superfamily protein YafD